MINAIEVLGAHGAKSQEGGTTSFLLDEFNVIDAGNLLLSLGDKSAKIKTVWLTHSHLDHIIDLAYILDNYYDKRTYPLKIIALEETIEILKEHFFNNKIWPNFAQIDLYDSDKKVLCYESIELGYKYNIENDTTIESFLGDHSVATVGHILKKGNKSLLLTSDTYTLKHVVDKVLEDKSISSLVIECSFPIALEGLAVASKHLTAQSLFDGLKPLENEGISLYINHIKPVYQKKIEAEIALLKGKWDVILLDDGDIIKF